MRLNLHICKMILLWTGNCSKFGLFKKYICVFVQKILPENTWVYFSVNLYVHTVFGTFRKTQNGPYISTSQTKIGNVCLSVISEFRLSVVVLFCSAPTGYINQCRGPEYQLKLPYFVQDYPNLIRYLIFQAVFCVLFGIFI